MQVVKYEINKGILIVGFKVDNFVVYAQVSYDENKTKDELLQLAYIQAKPSIEYEKTLNEHSFVTEEGGKEFIPEQPIPTNLDVNFDSLTGKVLDQYGDIYSTDIVFSIEGTDKAVIDGSLIIEEVVDENVEYEIVAKYGNLEDRQKRFIFAFEVDRVTKLRDEILPEVYKINSINNQLLEVQDYIVNKQYEELLNEGGL